MPKSVLKSKRGCFESLAELFSREITDLTLRPAVAQPSVAR